MTFEPIASPAAEDTAELLTKLGAALLDGGAIDKRTLDRARRVATETGGRLDQVLTQLGLMSDRGLAEALARLISAPLVEAADYPETPLFHDRLKAKFLRRAPAMLSRLRSAGQWPLQWRSRSNWKPPSIGSTPKLGRSMPRPNSTRSSRMP